MRILYLSPINVDNSYNNGGGWISSLIKEVALLNDNEIAVYWIGASSFKKKWGSITLYSGNLKFSFILKWLHLFNLDKRYKDYKKEFGKSITEVIEDFDPDVIHVFGSETILGLCTEYTDKPVVVHIQGILNPYYNALFPPFIGWRNMTSFSLVSLTRRYIMQKYWLMNCKRECEIYKNVHYYIGRTDWDKRVTFCLNPHATYYHGEEILRDAFYTAKYRIFPKSLTIVSTISSPYYKGLDMILKTADILKNRIKIGFEWKVYGNVNARKIEKIIGINHKEVNVFLEGVVASEELQNQLLNSTCYMHPSYIDNSPNSLCEAQILGVPSVACNVGGLESMIDNGKTGFLIPANDPYQAAFLIYELYKNENLNMSIGEQARKVALIRHDKSNIVKNLMNTYSNILHTN